MTATESTSLKALSPKELLRIESVAKTAALLFDKAGYHETSLKDISNAASLSKGAIYYYFSNKHEILHYILDNYMDLLLNGLEEELAQIPDSLSKLRHLLSRHMSTFSSHASSARILLKYAHNLPASELAGVVRKQKQYAQILAEILADNAGHRLDKKQIKACSYIVFGMYNSIIYWHRPDGPLPLSELTEICCELFLNGWKSFIAKNGKPSG
ncbi:TetR/AcrR family transcriptional regulator [Pseudorhodoplanes sp.]|uniref:TetR/AcrR family transcriptional regulator n=1 Tax=Pseudorhodoplanes sp. TaxID=1934341 RepID=UPI00391BD24A